MPRPSPTPSRTPAATAGRVEKPRFDWSALIAAKDAEISRLEAVYHDRLRRAGVQLCAARATVLDPHRVRLANGAEYTASHLLIATGGGPCVPAIPGAELGITSNEIFDLETQPKRMLIVGGGYVACEFAGIMNGLGTHVIQLYRGDQILRGFDAGPARRRGGRHARARDRARDPARRHRRSRRSRAGLRVSVDNGETHLVDQVLFATGRRPNTAGLGLEPLGRQARPPTARSASTTGRRRRCPRSSRWATSPTGSQLTPVAIHEGQAFADTVFGGRPRRSDHAHIPTAIFTQPEAATLGLSRGRRARARGRSRSTAPGSARCSTPSPGGRSGR